MTTAIAKTEQQQMQQRPTGELTVQDLVDRKRKILDVMQAVMIEGEHYGKIPGCGDKPTLFKAGAEVLATTFGLAPRFKIEQTDFPGGHREIRIICQLVSIGTEKAIGEGVGSCSTMESKYRWRQGQRTCPACGSTAIRRSKDKPEWYCWRKIDGCGATFAANDPAITEQSVDRVENPDLADTYNTILKMAKKRAQVDATLTATGASDLLTQDIEDLPPASRGYDKPRNQNQRDQAEDAEFTDSADPRTLNRTADGEAPSRDVRLNAHAAVDDLEARTLDILADIKAAKSTEDVKAIAPRFNALPKGTKWRTMAYDVYTARIADLAMAKAAQGAAS